MSMNIRDLEEHRSTAHPTAPRVEANFDVMQKQWVVHCPYCHFHHRHGSEHGDADSAGLRSPHCEDGAPGKPDYYLIPGGPLNPCTVQEILRIDNRRRRALAKRSRVR